MPHNRHHDTKEQRAVVLRVDPKSLPSHAIGLADQILLTPAEDHTKWMTRQACIDYQAVFFGQVLDLRIKVRDDPHSRNILMTGPPNGCWITTQCLSLPHGGYEVIANYRSLDKEHQLIDFALQYLIGQEITGGKVEVLHLMVGSYHEYI